MKREREKEKEFFEIADDVRGSIFYIIEELESNRVF